MGRFDGGISYFSHRMLDISFPEDVVCCYYCPLLYKDKLDRPICNRTGEIIINTMSGTGYLCPLQAPREINNEV